MVTTLLLLAAIGQAEAETPPCPMRHIECDVVEMNWWTREGMDDFRQVVLWRTRWSKEDNRVLWIDAGYCMQHDATLLHDGDSWLLVVPSRNTIVRARQATFSVTPSDAEYIRDATNWAW